MGVNTPRYRAFFTPHFATTPAITGGYDIFAAREKAPFPHSSAPFCTFRAPFCTGKYRCEDIQNRYHYRSLTLRLPLFERMECDDHAPARLRQ